MKLQSAPPNPTDIFVGVVDSDGDAFEAFMRGDRIILRCEGHIYQSKYSAAKMAPVGWIWRRAAALVDTYKDPSISPNSGRSSGAAGS